MPVCNECSFAIIKLRPQVRIPSPSDSEIHIALPQFKPATVSDCWICAKFSVWLGTEHPELFDVWHKGKAHVVYSSMARVDIEMPQQRLLYIFGMNITPQGHDPDYVACGVDLNLVPAEDFEACPFTQPKRRLDFAVPTTWIENCKRNHVKCGQENNLWYPTRLLHFGPQDRKVRLVISKDHSPKGPYITLSHRWGKHMKLKLTSATMTKLQSGVPLSSLSQVFRDSVNIAQRLRISYLWIDALCIKQDEDDLSDWNIESHSMNQVYANSFLNISATLCIEGDESLLSHREMGPSLPSKIKLDVGGISQDYFIIDSDFWYDEIDNAPLNNRGWVFQERFSARRVLHFGRQQLAWECKELEATEMYPEGLPRASSASYISKVSIHEGLTTLSQSPSETLDKALASEWHLLVQNYSKCGLTFPKDKLIAFEGVTQAYTTKRGGRCVAGVWQNNIAFDLTWYRSSEAKESFPIDSTAFRAPSWSWACVDGPVDYPAFLGELQRHFITDGEILEPDPNETTALSGQPSIRLQGSCLSLKIIWAHGEMCSFKTAKFRFPLAESFGATITLDGPEEEVQDLVHKSKIFWLPLVATSQCIYGLVLARVRGVSKFRRVGAIEIPMVESFSQTSSEISVPDQREINKAEETTQPGKPEAGPADQGQDPLSDTKWNMTALGLAYHIDALKRSRISIC